MLFQDLTSHNYDLVAVTDFCPSIWPTEVSRQLPAKARIDCFDVSSAQYPHQNWLPTNMYLHVHDAFAPFPSDHIGAYDIVHVRFFVTLVSKDSVDGLVGNLMSLLSMHFIHVKTSGITSGAHCSSMDFLIILMTTGRTGRLSPVD